jgi:hypothetical protein
MVKRSVRVYIEGGADGKTADGAFREGWRKFLRELDELARSRGYLSLQVVRGKDRARAYKLFAGHKTRHPQDLCVLLVDSEIAVPTGTNPWSVVANREGDKWPRPSWATERHLYLMVHFVETWLLTDQDALLQFFKKGFNSRPLPTTNLEGRSKADIENALKKATKDTLKGTYRHGQAHEIMGLVDPERVKTLTHGDRLFSMLSKLINNEP